MYQTPRSYVFFSHTLKGKDTGVGIVFPEELVADDLCCNDTENNAITAEAEGKVAMG